MFRSALCCGVPLDEATSLRLRSRVLRSKADGLGVFGALVGLVLWLFGREAARKPILGFPLSPF